MPAALLAAVFVVAAGLCFASLWLRRGAHDRAPAAEANHVVMSVAMAAMFLPATAGAVGPVAGAVAFGALAVAWALRLVALRARGGSLGPVIGRARCTAHPTHLLLANAAMVVMYVTMAAAAPAPEPAMTGMAGMAGMDHAGAHTGHAATPLALGALGVALAVYLLVHAGATVALLVRRRAAVPLGPGAGAAPAGGVGGVLASAPVQLGCQAVTGAGMALTLLLHT